MEDVKCVVQNNRPLYKIFDINRKAGCDLRYAMRVCGIDPVVDSGWNRTTWIDMEGLERVAEFYSVKAGKKKIVGRKLTTIIEELKSESVEEQLEMELPEKFEPDGLGVRNAPPMESGSKSCENGMFSCKSITISSNSVAEFINEKFGTVRAAWIEGEPWFVGVDIATALGYKNARRAIQDHVIESDMMIGIVQTSKGERQPILVNESGVYRLAFSSKLEKAIEFTHWVTSDVIPTIRRHGAYMTPKVIEQTLSDPDFIIRLATQLKDEREKRMALEAAAEENAPKIEFAEIVQDDCGALTLGEFAKVLYEKHGVDIGRNRLFDWMRRKGYFTLQDSLPYQRYLDGGLFIINEKVNRETGTVYRQVNITGKGQIALIKKIMSDFEREVL